MSHTIVLLQKQKPKHTRTYFDYETIPKAMNGLIELYEQELSNLNPNVAQISYDVKDLHDYIDFQYDLCALVFDKKTNGYVPHGKDWVKTTVLQHLKRSL